MSDGARMLQAYRRATRPDDDARARILDRLEPAQRWQRSPWPRVLVASSVALAIAATVILGLSVGYRAVLGRADDAAASEAMDQRQAQPRSDTEAKGRLGDGARRGGEASQIRGAAPDEQAVAPPGPPVPGPAQSAASAHRGDTTSRGRARAPAPAKGASPSASAPSSSDGAAKGAADVRTADPPTLADEARLIAEAERALGRGKVEAALGHLRRHERLFPRGGLAVERRVLLAVALCRQGQRDAGLAAAALDAMPADSPMRRRVELACH